MRYLRQRMKLRYHLPAIAVGAAASLFVVAAMRYPGGTTDSPGSIGYSWGHNFLSALFQPRALNGAPNAARPVAILATAVLCVGVGALFAILSRRIGSRPHRKTIEIGGIGAAVYSLLVVTPMHNLMVDIGLAFTITTLLALAHLLYVERRGFLLAWGLVSVVLTLASAVMYFGHVFYGLLPVAQKLGIVMSVSWILLVYYAALAHPMMVRSAPDIAAVRAAGLTSPPEA
jgi:hypothetical protein